MMRGSRILHLLICFLVLAAIVAGCVKSPTTLVPTPIPAAQVYFLHTKVSLNEAGIIKVEPPPNQNGGYKAGTTITLYAVVNPGFSFKQWVQGPAAENFSTQNPLTITITSNLDIAAVFGKEEPIPTPVPPAKDDIRYFIVGDEPFQFVGAFVPSWKTGGLPEPKSESEKKAFMEKLPQATDNLIATAKMAGLNVLTLILGWSKNDSENEMALGKLDVFLDRASAHNVRVIVTFLQGVGLTLEKESPFHDTVGTEGLIRDENLKSVYKDMVKQVVTHVNTVNGKTYSDDPTIMAWDLISEPFVDPGKFIQGAGKSTLTEEELGSWVQEMVTYTKSIDSNHLVTMMLSSPLVNWPLSVKALDFVAFDVNLYDILYVEERSKNQPLGNDYIEKFIRYPLSSIGKPFVPQLAFTTPWLTEEFATDYELQGQIYKEALQKGFESGIAGAIIFSWGETGVGLFNFENYLGYDITDEEIIIPIKEIVAGLPPIDGSKSSSQFVRIAP